ncbi:hypothetical protein [Paraburkholderia domus]|uniref:hypothetical protein n=1 Tax=Paraburkholderia domus TaxID=2793075 RepID=UPI00191247E9|nr:hypothetical protein [Paraburkholderia domus]MBK5058878.1 hypothetical protein [Burkholderia sp. R-70199]CAE6879687.1 hypothetical protein R70199_02448 [Paraburkholderia domus]
MDPFDQLDAAMNAYDDRKVQARAAADQKRAEEDAFIAEFSNFRSITAHPVLEEIGNRLHQRGHEFQVEMNDPVRGTGRRPIGITLHVYPAGTDGRHATRSDHPQFTINGDPYSRKVKFHSVITYPGGGMQSGPEGTDYNLEELSADVLRTKAIAVIAKSFASR